MQRVGSYKFLTKNQKYKIEQPELKNMTTEMKNTRRNQQQDKWGKRTSASDVLSVSVLEDKIVEISAMEQNKIFDLWNNLTGIYCIAQIPGIAVS